MQQSSGKSAEQQFVLSVAYSPDGESLACGCMDGTVCIFDVRKGQLKAELVGHFKPVRSLVFTPGTSLRPRRLCLRATRRPARRSGAALHVWDCVAASECALASPHAPARGRVAAALCASRMHHSPGAALHEEVGCEAPC